MKTFTPIIAYPIAAGFGLLCLAAGGPLRAQAAPAGAEPIGLQQAYLDYKARNFSAAVPELTAIVGRSPDSVEAHEMLAGIYTMQNRIPDAIPEMEAVVRLKPLDMSFRENLGVAYLQAGSPAKAAGMFQTVLAQNPANAGYAFEYAVALEKCGRHAEAAAAFEGAAALDPKNSRAPLYAGLLYHQIGSDTKAIPCLKSALSLGTSEKCSAETALAEAADAAGRTSDAIEDYTEAAKADPGDFGAEANLGILEQNAGSKTEAEASYRQALTRKTQDLKSVAAIKSNLALLLAGDGRLNEAGALLAEAAQADPANAALQNDLGAVSEKQGRRDDALAAYRRALTLSPNDPAAKDGIARLSKP